MYADDIIVCLHKAYRAAQTNAAWQGKRLGASLKRKESLPSQQQAQGVACRHEEPNASQQVKSARQCLSPSKQGQADGPVSQHAMSVPEISSQPQGAWCPARPVARKPMVTPIMTGLDWIDSQEHHGQQHGTRQLGLSLSGQSGLTTYSCCSQWLDNTSVKLTFPPMPCTSIPGQSHEASPKLVSIWHPPPPMVPFPSEIAAASQESARQECW